MGGEREGPPHVTSKRGTLHLLLIFFFYRTDRGLLCSNMYQAREARCKILYLGPKIQLSLSGLLAPLTPGAGYAPGGHCMKILAPNKLYWCFCSIMYQATMMPVVIESSETNKGFI